MIYREWLRHAVVTAGLLTATGCPSRNDNGVSGGSPGSVASFAGASPFLDASPRQRDAAASSTSPDNELVLALDGIGLAVRDQRVDLDSPDAEEKLEEIARSALSDHPTISVTAARDSRVRWIRALVRTFGVAGVRTIRVSTPTAVTAGRTPILPMTPLGQVPAQEARCGVRATIRTTHAVELQYMEKSITLLPAADRDDSEIKKALDEVRGRTTGCRSTVWMLAGEREATWGDAFDLGVAVLQSSAGAPLYIMLR
jgi:hypothetical protein